MNYVVVSTNWGPCFGGVLAVRAHYWGSRLGPLIIGNSHVRFCEV